MRNVLVFALVLGAATAAAARVTLTPAAGVFQYYTYDYGIAASRVGPAAALALRLERDASAFEVEARYRGYADGPYMAGGEARAAFYFHAAPARPYIAPTVGFWMPGDGAQTYKVAGAGARAGALLAAEGSTLSLDVYGGYTGQFNFDYNDQRPAFFSELAAGARGDWRLTARVSLYFEGRILWPGFFGEKHGRLYTVGVAPFVLAGPAFVL